MNNICKKLLNTKQCMAFFLKLKRNYLLKTNGYPIFSFWISMVLTKIYFLRIVLNCEKNIAVFESITDRKTRVSRDAQVVCAITIVGTALKTRFCGLKINHQI